MIINNKDYDSISAAKDKELENWKITMSIVKWKIKASMQSAVDGL